MGRDQALEMWTKHCLLLATVRHYSLSTKKSLTATTLAIRVQARVHQQLDVDLLLDVERRWLHTELAPHLAPFEAHCNHIAIT